MAIRNPDGTFIINGKILYGDSPVTMEDLVDLFPAIGKIQAIVANAVAATAPKTRKSTKPKASPEHVAKIIALHKEGYTNKQIADHLGINGQSVNGVIASAKRQGDLPPAGPVTKGVVMTALRPGLEKALSVDLVDRKPLPVPTLQERGWVVVDSSFRGPEGHVYTFRFEDGKSFANLAVDRRNGGGLSMTIGVAAVLDKREVDRAFDLLGIYDRSSASALWLQACLSAMKLAGKKKCPGCGHAQPNGAETTSGRCLDCDRTSPSTGNHLKKREVWRKNRSYRRRKK